MKKIKHYKSFAQLWIESIKHMRIHRCLYPNCKNKDIVKSHTLQKKGVVSQLTVNGQVCMPRISRDSTYPFDKKMGIKLREVGQNEATTFTGFCKEHDDKIFAPIEKLEWIPDEQSEFLFTYRTICSELQTKQELIKRMNYVISQEFRTTDDLTKYKQNDYTLWQLAVTDLLRVKKQCDYYLESKRKESPISGIILNMPKANFAISGYYMPYYDFKQNLINEKYGKTNYPMFVNIIPYKDRTIVFLTAYKEDYKKYYEDYLNVIKNLPEEIKEIFLTNISIKSSDNLIINPKSAQKLTKIQVEMVEGEANGIASTYEQCYKSSQGDLFDKGLNLFRI